MERLLFVHRGTAVEFLLCLPALQATRRRFPQAQVWLAAPDFACDLARLADCVDVVHPLGAHRSLVSGPSLFQSLRALVVLRRHVFDAVIGLTDAIPEQVGRLWLRAHRQLTLQTDVGRRVQHVTDAAAALVAALGVPNVPPTPQLLLPPPVLQAEQNRLAKLGWRDNGLTFVLHPTVGFAPQVWPAEHIVPLAARLTAEYGAQLLIVETEEEPGLTDRFQSEWKRYNLKPVVLRRPHAALLAVALAQASVVVGSNCAPVHVAVALRTPVVVVIEATAAARLAPRGSLSRLLYALPARPVGVDDVFDVVCQVMAASRTGMLFEGKGGR